MRLQQRATELRFSSDFVDSLPGEAPREPVEARQVTGQCYAEVSPTPVSAPSLLVANVKLAEALGFSEARIREEDFVQVLAGNALFESMRPYAMCYGGHQFGQWAGQLGDGRAINLAERDFAVAQDHGLTQATLQLKGAGPTPFSRFADGRAVLRSSLREYVCSEAMHALGVPTTRALSLVLTGDHVERDMFYDGRPAYEPGAIVCRVSPSFIRFGNFELPASRGDLPLLTRWVEFTLSRYYPVQWQLYRVDPVEGLLSFLAEVQSRSLDLVVHWMRLGFVHAVLNTDNMSILGETIDYGPFGWIDDFAPDWTPNTTDRQHRRYRFGQQPAVVHWNLFQLANALFPLVREAEPLEAILSGFEPEYERRWLAMMRKRLGLTDEAASDLAFFNELESLMSDLSLDMTLFYRLLTETPVTEMTRPNFIEACRALSYRTTDSDQWDALQSWLGRYQQRRASGDPQKSVASMSAANPCIVPRNFILQELVDKVGEGDVDSLNQALRAFERPYDNGDEQRPFKRMRPDWALDRPGCSSLSCSS